MNLYLENNMHTQMRYLILNSKGLHHINLPYESFCVGIKN